MKRIILMGMVAIGCVSLAQAQTKTDDEKLVVYKWYQKGRAHYAKVPPHGVTNYIRLNEYGIVITDRPADDEFNGSILRPMRPDSAQNAPVSPAGSASAAPSSAPTPTPAAANQGKQPLPEGTITRETRCKEAQENLNTINNKKTVYQEDNNGNLVPLSAEEVESRRSQAQETISNYCN